jgi:hypothetical protein
MSGAFAASLVEVHYSGLNMQGRVTQVSRGEAFGGLAIALSEVYASVVAKHKANVSASCNILLRFLIQGLTTRPRSWTFSLD